MPAFDLRLQLTHETITHATILASSIDEAKAKAINRFKIAGKGVRVLESGESSDDLLTARANLRSAWEHFQLQIIAIDDASRDFNQALIKYQTLINAKRERKGQGTVDFVQARLVGQVQDEPDLLDDSLTLFRAKLAQFRAAGG